MSNITGTSQFTEKYFFVWHPGTSMEIPGKLEEVYQRLHAENTVDALICAIDMFESYVQWRLLIAIEVKGAPLEAREWIAESRASALQFLYEGAVAILVTFARKLSIDPKPIELSAIYCQQLFSQEIPPALNENNCSWPGCLANMPHSLTQAELEEIRLGEARLGQLRSGFGLVSSSPKTLANRLVADAKDANKRDTKGGDEPKAIETAKTWQDVANRMERLRTQGEPFTSQSKMAEAFGCSSGTINKAIKNTPSLQAWAKPKDVTAPKAQSLSSMKHGEYVDVVTDRTPSSAPDPADEAAIREYLEQEDLRPDERAFFNGLSPKDQLEFLDDPDKYPKILGRKP